MHLSSIENMHTMHSIEMTSSIEAKQSKHLMLYSHLVKAMVNCLAYGQVVLPLFDWKNTYTFLYHSIEWLFYLDVSCPNLNRTPSSTTLIWFGHSPNHNWIGSQLLYNSTYYQLLLDRAKCSKTGNFLSLINLPFNLGVPYWKIPKQHDYLKWDDLP